MPIYGDDKIKDMIESLLPSSRRDTARRSRRAAHRKARRAYKQNPDRFDDADRRRNIEIGHMMWDRRAADKLSFVRWAEERTKALEDGQERYNYIKGLVPDNTIGRHALTHIDHLVEGRTYTSQKAYRRRSKEDALQRRKEWAEELRDLLGLPGFHSGLNRAIKQAHDPLGHMERRRASMYKMEDIGRVKCPECEHPRTLAGLHDVDAFLEAITRSQHREWKSAVERFIAGWRR